MAQDHFNSRDHEGLQRLLAILQAHHDKKRANDLIPLVQGYLAELRNEPKVAIEAYQRIAEKSAHKINALKRLFEIYIKSQDYDQALSALKSLADKELVYVPMYADLLQATGNSNNAVEVYTDYLLANPNDLNTMLKLGKIYLQEGVADGVAWTMSYILDKDPENKEALELLSEMGLSMESTEISEN